MMGSMVRRPRRNVRNTRRPASRRRRRNRRGALGTTPSVHASEVGRTLIIAEKAAADTEELVAQGECFKAYGRLQRARSALGVAHGHAAASGMEQAIREVSATDADVANAARTFGRVCICKPRR